MEITERTNGDDAQRADHLCILVHGLWGNPAHLAQVASALRDRHAETHLRILVAESNAGTFTYDGIELGGERVTKEIEDTLDRLANEGQHIKKISIVGYSLGGLIARYAIGLLYSKGWFEKLEPVNFTTFATPHLGVRTPLKGWHHHLWNTLGARTLSTSGRQLFLIDSFRDTGKPLLTLLADSNSIFIRGLSRFRNRCVYANITNDRSAVYYTTAITSTDPFTDLDSIKVNYEDGYDSVIVDSERYLSTLNDEGKSKTLMDRISLGTGAVIQKIPIVALLVVVIPIGSTVFLVNSGIQSFRSQKRIRLHEEGKAGIGIGSYRIPLMLQEAKSVVEGAYGGMNRRQSQEYLGEEESRRRERRSSVNSLRQLNSSTGNTINNAITEEPEGIAESEKHLKPNDNPLSNQEKSHFPTLALTDDQFAMIEALDAVGFRKHPVHIHKVRHSHAAIIQRSTRNGYEEGKIVMRHWLDKEFEI